MEIITQFTFELIFPPKIHMNELVNYPSNVNVIFLLNDNDLIEGRTIVDLIYSHWKSENSISTRDSLMGT